MLCSGCIDTPTRIVPRKGIEHTIKLVGLLKDPRFKVVISHDAGDEGFEYQHILQEMAQDDGVEYESDLLVQIDTHLLVVEAKSGSISACDDRIARFVNCPRKRTFLSHKVCSSQCDVIMKAPNINL